MKPERWQYHPREQMELTRLRPIEVQRATAVIMETVGDTLVEIGLGKRLSENGPPMGGLISAIEAAIAQAIIFMLTNEDPAYVARHRLVEGTPGQGLLVAQVSPQEQARLAQEALRREDPRR